MKKKLKLISGRKIAFLHDVFMIIFAWIFAYYVHQNFGFLSEKILNQVFLYIPVLVFIQASFFITFGMYRSVWRFASVPDLIQIIKAIVLGTIIALFFFSYALKEPMIPRSVPLLYAVFLLLFLSFGRLAVRWRQDHYYFFRQNNSKRVLLVGFCNEAESLIREMLRDANCQYLPVAIVDADSKKLNCEMHRIPVVGTCDQIQAITRKYKIDVIFIAMPNISSHEMNLILQESQAASVPYRIISNFRNASSSNHLLSSMREVNLDDLLGRETYQVDTGLFYSTIQGKKVLVTGGGGSIGSELCRQIASLNPTELFILDQCEANLYHIERELHQQFAQVKITVALIDVTNLPILETFFKKNRPELVFHAAAYKHVPMLEKQILAAVKNNILGTRNVADMAVKYHADSFVQVSTDKAVNPTNIMGMTKRAAEIYCQHLHLSVKTKMITVRFGNVLGSVGSVVPLFLEQLKRGGPLTVTHPDITRYFMTIPEACQLIFQAMTMGKGGEIFVLDMGEPIKITQLAEQMIRLSGKKVDEDIKIVYTGLRAGEKLWEDLFYTKEMMETTRHKKIFRAEACCFDFKFVQSAVSALVRDCQLQDNEAAFDHLIALVPEYQDTRKKVSHLQPAVVCE